MSQNLSDQEQIQLLKDWWKKYGTYILTGVFVFLASNYGWRHWQSYQARQAELASVTYNQMIYALQLDKKDEASLLVKHLIKDQKKSVYASLAALVEAKEAVLKNQLSLAEEKLLWVIKHGKQNTLRQLARIRLARVFLEEKRPPQAIDILKTVDDEVLLAAVFEARADALFSLGKQEEALVNYKKALAANTEAGVESPFLQMKMQQL